MSIPVGFHHSAETRRKMSSAHKKVSPESRAKMSSAHTGISLGPRHCANISIALRGKKNPNWRGGSAHAGYVYLRCPDHPFATQRGYVMEHRLVMEAHVGRVLLPTEVVHHVNGIVKDNRIENLMLFSSNGEHLRHQTKGRIKEAG